MRRFVRELHQGMVTFMAGMRVTGNYLRANFRSKPQKVVTTTFDGTAAQTKLVVVTPKFRGNLSCDTTKCGVCRQCVRACPVDCFYIEGERNEAGKLRPSRFDIDIGKCIYCGLCVRACAADCLTMTPEWAGATKAAEQKTEGDAHGLVRSFGLGFYTPEQKLENEKKRQAAEEARKKAAAEAAAKKAAAAKAASAAAPAPPAPPAAPAGPASPPAPPASA